MGVVYGWCLGLVYACSMVVNEGSMLGVGVCKWVVCGCVYGVYGVCGVCGVCEIVYGVWS